MCLHVPLGIQRGQGTRGNQSNPVSMGDCRKHLYLSAEPSRLPLGCGFTVTVKEFSGNTVSHFCKSEIQGNTGQPGALKNKTGQ